MGTVLVEQECVECNVTDTKPRHHIYDAATGKVYSRHMDCCAKNGCAICK